MDSSTEKEAQEATWEKVQEYFTEIVERLEKQQNDRIDRLKQALEDVE